MIEDHFWLMVALWCGGGGYFFGKNNSKRLIEVGEYSEQEVHYYLLITSACVFVPSLAFWMLQISVGAGVGSDFSRWPNPQKLIAHSLLVGLWAYLLVWTFFYGGARPLSRTMRLMGAYPKFMHTVTAAKWLVVLVIISGVSSLFL